MPTSFCSTLKVGQLRVIQFNAGGGCAGGGERAFALEINVPLFKKEKIQPGERVFWLEDVFFGGLRKFIFSTRSIVRATGVIRFVVSPRLGARQTLIYNVYMDAAVLGDRLLEVIQRAFPWPRHPLFAVLELRELESACRVSIL